MHQQVLTGRNAYSEVQWREQVLRSSDPHKSPSGIFHPPRNPAATFFNTMGMVGKGSPPV
eukprot:9072808-Lingulodinium_polyedra.AAC.1